MNNLIGGNVTIQLKRKVSETTNRIGEANPVYQNYLKPFDGFLDYSSGEVGHQNFNSAIQESTHIFVADYVEIKEETENLIAEINNKTYEVKFVDNPMELNEQIEIYLKYIGKQKNE